MSVAKNIEISASSRESFGDAIRSGIARTTDSVDDVRGAWIKEQQVRVEKGEITEYRVNMVVTFVIRES
jgi:flavin-binding protein dodecin